MTIEEKRNGDSLTVAPKGRLDAVSAPELEARLKEYYPVVTELILDFEELEYISSAGLRVVIQAEKAMKEYGGVQIRNASKTVQDVFRVTGLKELLQMDDEGDCV